MNNSVLVTGCNGFVGSFLCNSLYKKEKNVFGIDKQLNPKYSWVKYSQIDICNFKELITFIKDNKILEIYHLAAIANPRVCEKNPNNAIKVNIQGTVNLYEICRKINSIKLIVVGSSEEYKRINKTHITYSENDELEPHNIYSSTKICSEIIGKTYVNNYSAKIIFTRSFNHTGPGQSPNYVLSNFSKQCAEIKKGLRLPMIEVGNIDIKKDFLDVQDVVLAYQMLMEKGKIGESYNVASGKAYSLRDLLMKLIHLTKRNDVKIIVKHERFREEENLSITGNIDKIFRDVSWRPFISIYSSIKNNLFYWDKIL